MFRAISGLSFGRLLLLRDSRHVQIEHRKQVEEEFRRLCDVLPEYMCIYEADRTPLYANDSLLELFGFALEDFRANDFQTRAFHPEDVGSGALCTQQSYGPRRGGGARGSNSKEGRSLSLVCDSWQTAARRNWQYCSLVLFWHQHGRSQTGGTGTAAVG
jgi:PAS domain-containing protein